MTCLLLRNMDNALFENVNKRCEQQLSVSVSRCFAAGSGCQLSTSSVVSVDASQKSDARMPASDSPTDIPSVTACLMPLPAAESKSKSEGKCQQFFFNFRNFHLTSLLPGKFFPGCHPQVGRSFAEVPAGYLLWCRCTAELYELNDEYTCQWHLPMHINWWDNSC